MAVYLLHLERPLGNCSHYLGHAEDVDRRYDIHAKGHGASFTRAAVHRGIKFAVVRVWADADKATERRLKKQKKAWRLCPVCKEAKRVEERRQEAERRVKRKMAAEKQAKEDRGQAA